MQTNIKNNIHQSTYERFRLETQTYLQTTCNKEAGGGGGGRSGKSGRLQGFPEIITFCPDIGFE